MVHIFFLPYLGNRSKSDPCSYELFCLESHILSFPKVLQIPPESPCRSALVGVWNSVNSNAQWNSKIHYKLDGPRSKPQQEHEIFPSYPAVGPGNGTDHPPHIEPRLRKGRAIPLLPAHAFMECYWVTFTFTKLKTVLEGTACSFIQPWTLGSNTNQKEECSWWNMLIISITAVITFGPRWICEWMDHGLFNDTLKSEVTRYWVLLEDVPTFSIPERTE